MMIKQSIVGMALTPNTLQNIFQEKRLSLERQEDLEKLSMSSHKLSEEGL